MQVSDRYHGIWWSPINNEWVSLNECFGELTREDDGKYQLELFRHPGGCLRCYHYYIVLWGKDSNETPITLFGVRWIKNKGGFEITYNVKYALIGLHVLSMEAPRFSGYIVRFPFLQNWTEVNMMQGMVSEDEKRVVIDPVTIHKHFEVEIEKGLHYEVSSQFTWQASPYSAESHNDTVLLVLTQQPISINDCLEKIGEFSKFLSIALYSKQTPVRIGLKVKGYPYPFEFLFSNKVSKNPRNRTLLPMKELKERLPDIFKRWHEVYEDISPICNSLLNSLQSDEFDFPDFLIVAQALDGYCQRFEQSPIKNQTYTDGIKSLLSLFEGVSAVSKCRFDIETIRDSRNHYSHLLSKGKKKHVAKGRDLLLLTAKCKILLACCILKELGLSIEEINQCCDRSGLLADAEAICDEEEVIGRTFKDEINVEQSQKI